MLQGEQILSECWWGLQIRAEFCNASTFATSSSQMQCGLVNILCCETQSCSHKGYRQIRAPPVALCLEATQPCSHSTKLQLRHWSNSSSSPSKARTTLFLPAHVDVTTKTWNTDSFPYLNTKAFFNFDEILLSLNITVFSVPFFLNFYYLDFRFF